MTDWTPATLILQPSKDGFHGSLHMGGITLDVRRWHKAASGVVKFEIKHDTEWVAYLDRQTKLVAGG